MRFIQSKKKWVDEYNMGQSLVSDLEVLQEFQKEGEVSGDEVEKQYENALSAIEKLEFKNMLSEE